MQHSLFYICIGMTVFLPFEHRNAVKAVFSDFIATMFVEQPLALLGSAEYKILQIFKSLITDIVMYITVLYQIIKKKKLVRNVLTSTNNMR